MMCSMFRLLCTSWLYLVSARSADGDSNFCPTKCTCSQEHHLVDCRGLGLQHVPKLPPMTTTLLLSHNNISQVSRNDFSECPDLMTLELSNNHLKKLERNSFVDLPKLVTLRLEDNDLDLNDTETGLPIGTLHPLQALRELHIQNNVWQHMVEYREDIVQNKPDLQALSIDSPPGTISLPATYSDLHMLDQLTLYGGISALGNDTLSALSTTPLKELRFNGGKLKSIDILSFSDLTSMTLLDLSNNQGLGFGPNLYQSWYSLRKTQIRSLYLQNICTYDTAHSTPPITADFFSYLNHTPLVELYLDNNGLSNIEAEFHKLLPRLQTLSMHYNSFFGYFRTLFSDLYFMKNLTYIDVSYQTEFPVPPQETLLQKSTYLFVEFPPNIRILNVSHALAILPLSISTLLIFTETTHMDVIDISQNAIGSIYEGLDVSPAHRLHVHYLNASGCSLSHFHLTLNEHLQIDIIDVSDNTLFNQFIQGYKLAAITNYTKTKEIFLSRNGIKNISFDFFQGATDIERIHLPYNALRVWNTSLSTLPNFTFLDLSENLLASLPRERISEIDHFAKTRAVSINLMGNPLICDCFTLYFLKWLNNTDATILNLENYTCVLNNTIVKMDKLKDLITSLEIQCSSKAWAIVTGVLFGVCIMLITVSVIVYRHRFDIRYACIRLVRQRIAEQEQNSARNYAFDAFVAYHNKDLNWVVHSLMARLESGPNPLRLCVHHRNWLPGPTIEENISWSVESSRKTLIILSRHFRRSGWCELEMQLARMRGLEEGQNVIIVIALEEIPPRELSRTLVNLRRTNTWLDWYDYENDREQFWQLLESALSNRYCHGNQTLPVLSGEDISVSETQPLVN